MSPTKNYLYFVQQPNPKRKTKLFAVTTESDLVLGYVKFKKEWRRYCFFPANDCLFDSNCLKEIIAFIDRLMHDRYLDLMVYKGVL